MGIVLKFFFILAFSSLIYKRSQNSFGIPLCNSNITLPSIDSLKSLASRNGYKLLYEKSVEMDSEYEVPLIVPLAAEHSYIYAFVGDPTSKLYEVRVFDWNEKMIKYEKKQWGEIDGYSIFLNVIPEYSEPYMFRAVQVNKKKKKVCGYIMFFEKER